MNLYLQTVTSKVRETRLIAPNFERIVDAFKLLDSVYPELIDTTAASVSRYLPDGNKEFTKQYRYMKVDNTANTVTIYALSGQTVMGTTSYVLAARYDRIWLVFCKATQDWVPISP